MDGQTFVYYKYLPTERCRADGQTLCVNLNLEDLKMNVFIKPGFRSAILPCWLRNTNNEKAKTTFYIKSIKNMKI